MARSIAELELDVDCGSPQPSFLDATMEDIDFVIDDDDDAAANGVSDRTVLAKNSNNQTVGSQISSQHAATNPVAANNKRWSATSSANGCSSCVTTAANTRGFRTPPQQRQQTLPRFYPNHNTPTNLSHIPVFCPTTPPDISPTTARHRSNQLPVPPIDWPLSHSRSRSHIGAGPILHSSRGNQDFKMGGPSNLLDLDKRSSLDNPMANSWPGFNPDFEGSRAYCIDRGNGQCTLLVPADLLSAKVSYPATQPHRPGLVMLPSLGTDGATTVGGIDSVHDRVFESENAADLQARIDAIVGGTPPTKSIRPPPIPDPRANASNTTAPMTTSNATNSRGPKVYCDHWIHYGTCSFVQQGCKYKHEMPTDVATQQRLGLTQGFPRWWKTHILEQQRPKPSEADMSDEVIDVNNLAFGRQRDEASQWPRPEWFSSGGSNSSSSSSNGGGGSSERDWRDLFAERRPDAFGDDYERDMERESRRPDFYARRRSQHGDSTPDGVRQPWRRPMSIRDETNGDFRTSPFGPIGGPLPPTSRRL